MDLMMLSMTNSTGSGRHISGIDQGPILIMIENHRTGLLWNSFMVDADVRAGLTKLGFQTTSVSAVPYSPDQFKIFPNPCAELAYIDHTGFELPVMMKIYSLDGRLLRVNEIINSDLLYSFDCSDLSNGIYLIHLSDRKRSGQARLVIRK
ncbi:MAG: T9SS type A sorting domain-containing protein [Bacteroidales bacterium]|nr:T9SS type A sorting domain-containing protein [Bacteroidales bacterium]